MAYSIRYGYDMRWRKGGNGMPGWQIAGALAFLALTVVLRIIWAEGAAAAERVLARGPSTVTEQAVAAFASALAEGEGWYRGLAVWCRTVIDGAV